VAARDSSPVQNSMATPDASSSSSFLAAIE
jgi:hypothetical protein